MKNKILFKIILLLVIIVLLGGIILFSEKIQKIPFIEKMKQAINEENNVTTVDVTGIELGKETQHEHIYKTMYDENKHWEECIVCNEKRNENTHTLTTTWAVGKESCGESNPYTKTCTCGYSFIGYKPCVWDGKTYIYEESMMRHAKQCSICKESILHSYYLNKYDSGKIYEGTTREWCYKSDGSRITCNNLGTCVICGKKRSNKTHDIQSIFDTGEVKCITCGESFGTFTYEITKDYAAPTTYTFVLNYNLENGAIFKALGGIRDTGNYWSSVTNTQTISKTNSRQFTITQKSRMKSTLKESYETYIYLTVTVDEIDCILRTEWDGINAKGYTVYPDSIEPTISNIVSGNGSSLVEWSKNKPITITGTENWTNTVNVEIVDDAGNTVYTGGGNVTNENYSVSCTPKLEAGLEGREFKAIVTDSCNNRTEKTFTISKIDGVAPEVTSVDKVDEEWSKEKSITFTASDHGIGNVQIAFNDVADYSLATKNGTEYSREYKLIGDVYSPREANVYYKDELGNISSKKVIIDKIDNTKPTITGASFRNNKLNVTANDRHQTEGEGSGVSKYRFITSTTKLENPEITLNNSTEVLANENMVIPEIYKVKYVYVVAEDAVGNISEVYEVKVPQLELTSKVNLSGANGKGIVELDWPSYDISNKYFVIYRKQENETEWETIVSLEENFNGNKYIDNLGNDNKNPSISNINIEGKQEANSIEITANSTDSGTKYIYYIESYDSNDMSLLSISNEK